MAGHFDHLVNLFSKRFGQLDDLIRKIIHLEASNQELEIHLAVTKKYFAVTKKICGHKKMIQLRRQEETSDFFLGVSACFGADAEVPRRPDDRHLEKKSSKGKVQK